MINAVLVFNNSGQPRLTKFYTQLVRPPRAPPPPPCTLPRSGMLTLPPAFQDTSVQQRLIGEIFALVSHRPASACNFLPLPPLLAPPPTSSSAAAPSTGSSAPAAATEPLHTDRPSLVTYRHYATLYFILISTSTESPLALLDLIQVFVEALDRLFENVCELDLIFNFETLHALLGEMIVGGVVVETALDKVVRGVREQGRVVQRSEVRGLGPGGMRGGLSGGLAALGWGGGGLR